MKKLISLILCLLMLFSAACTTAFADDTYEFFETRQAINRYNAEAPAEFVVPSEIGGIVVESILESAFRDNAAAVEKLTLPESLMFIGNRNFNKSAALAEVVLPETLQVVGSEVFRESAALTEITIPASVTMIGKSSFAKNENLKSVTFTGMAPLFVGKFAFGSNHPEMVIYVPDDQIDAYTAVLPEGLNIQPSGANAVVVDYTASEDAFTFDAASGTITATTNRSPRLDIPATIGGVPVTAIGAGVFKESIYACCIVVPEGVTTIGDEAFASCSFLDYVDLPDSVTTIGAKAFNGFQGTVFEFPAQLQTIGEKAFAYSNIDVVALPEGLTEIPASAFERAKFSSLTLPGNLTAIGEKAFYQCKYYNEVTIPASVTSIGSMAFAESDRLEKVITACDPSILPADALTDTKAVVEQFGAAEATPEPTAEPTPEPTADPTAEPTAEPTPEPTAEAIYAGSPFVGTWRCHVYEDGTLVLNADGTGLYTPDNPEYSPEEKAWSVNDDGTISFADSWWGGYEVVLREDGAMVIGDDWWVFTREDGAAPVETPVETPAVAVDASAVFGNWIATSAEMDGMEMDKAMLETFGLTVELVLNEDGTASLSMEGETEDGLTWTADGAGITLTLDGESLPVTFNDKGGLTMDFGGVYLHLEREGAESGASEPVENTGAATDVAGAAEDFVGTWNASTMEMEGMTMDVAALGMVMDLTITADGMITMFDGESSETAPWTLVDGVLDVMGEMQLTLTEDGRLCMADADAKMYFVRGEAGTSAPVETPVDTPADLSDCPVVGAWNDGNGTTLTVNADGTCVVTDEWGDSSMGWEIVDGVPTITTGSWYGAPMILNEDGTLYVNDGFVVNKTLMPGAYVAPDLSSSPVVGVWNDGESITFTVNADGTCVATDTWGDNNMEWTIQDGVPTINSGSWYGAPMILNDDGTLYVSDGWVVDTIFMPGELAAGEPTGSVVSGTVAGTAEDFVGTWNASVMEMEGMTMNVADMGMVMDLTITADGKITMFDGESTEEATWTLVDGVLDIMGEMQLTLTEDGRLCMAEDGAAMYFVRGEASVGGEAPAVEGIVPVAGEMEDFVGRWIGQTMEMDGQSYPLSDFGMTMEIEMGLYGNISLFDGETTEEGIWKLVDGKADIDGMVCTLMSDGTLVAEDPDGAKVVFTGFIGTWKACYLSTGGLTGDLRPMGITSTLVLNADGTGSIDFPTPEEGVWYREEGILRFGENGMPVTVLPGGFLKFGSDLGGYLVFSQDENAVWDPSMAEPEVPAATEEPVIPVVTEAPAAPEAPENAGEVDMQALMNRKFVAKTYTAYGQTMDASMLGAEYSLLFRENGTCDFGMAGMVVPNLPWGLQKVATGLTEVDAFVINYYGTMFNAVINANGFDMDFYGTMTLHFVPAE